MNRRTLDAPDGRAMHTNQRAFPDRARPLRARGETHPRAERCKPRRPAYAAGKDNEE